MLGKHLTRKQCKQLICPQDDAFTIDNANAVAIAIKRYTQV